MTDSLLALGREVLDKRYHHNKKGPKPGEHVQLFRMKQNHSKGFYSEKC